MIPSKMTDSKMIVNIMTLCKNVIMEELLCRMTLKQFVTQRNDIH
jgi:hypothetical protein